MLNLQDLISKAQKHPVFTTFAFVGALVIGLGSFTDALSKLSIKAKCLPVQMGFGGAYEGQVVVKLTTIEKDWRKLRRVKTERLTGNHHCEDDCRGEPTRSNYLIDLSSSDFMTPDHPQLEFREPKIKCKSGPCGAWNHVWYARTSENSKSAQASFDVWSRPTKWELSADLYSYQIVNKEEAQEVMNVSSDSLFTLNVKANQKVDVIKAVMSDKRQLTWTIGESDPSGTIVFVSKSTNQTETEYVYQVSDQRCK